jgi:hypothetical protein
MPRESDTFTTTAQMAYRYASTIIQLGESDRRLAFFGVRTTKLHLSMSTVACITIRGLRDLEANDTLHW